MDGSEAAVGTTVSPKSMRTEDWITYVVVVSLLAAAAYRLEVTIGRSEALFGRGIALVERAFTAHSIESGLASHQIFTLTVAHEVVTFKATALFLGAIISVLGALFVLRAGQVAYRASFEASGWKLSLGTSSPGLVMITLGCALISVAVLTRANVENNVPTNVNGSNVVSQAGAASKAAEDIKKYRAFLESHKSNDLSATTETKNE